MKMVDRRRFLQLATLTGAGVAIGGMRMLLKMSEPESLFMITSNPDCDLERLMSITNPGWGTTVETKLIQPAPQDLSLVLDGQMMDPINNPAYKGLSNMAHEMRNRSDLGSYFVTIASIRQAPSEEIIIEVDGQIVHRIGLNETATGIVAPGVYGQTVFNLQAGSLSVVEHSCRHGLCRKMGRVQKGKIVCAPNKLVATIRRNGTGLDALTG